MAATFTAVRGELRGVILSREDGEGSLRHVHGPAPDPSPSSRLRMTNAQPARGADDDADDATPQAFFVGNIGTGCRRFASRAWRISRPLPRRRAAPRRSDRRRL